MPFRTSNKTYWQKPDTIWKSIWERAEKRKKEKQNEVVTRSFKLSLHKLIVIHIFWNNRNEKMDLLVFKRRRVFMIGSVFVAWHLSLQKNLETKKWVDYFPPD